jgi:catechol 2,3-dioxygenase-like lactoylglutathione lyase family enzyme
LFNCQVSISGFPLSRRSASPLPGPDRRLTCFQRYPDGNVLEKAEERKMISHVSLGVSDSAKSVRFYDSVLAPLGFTRQDGTKPGETAYGPEGSGVFWLYEVAEGGAPLASPGTHIAFQARSRETLHEAAAAAAGAGSRFTREPGPHPDIALDYYGAVFLDPDGHKLEIVLEPD